MKRVYNFNAGPAALPKQALKRAQEELLNFQETGMSVMELSHRSKEYDKVHQKAATLLQELLQIPDDYDILFMQGGASLQFSAIPMNFLPLGKTANYSLSGSWSEKALKEAQKMGSTHIASTAKDSGYTSIPSHLELSKDAAYLHVTSNNTIFGTQWKEFPTISPHIPLIADMSSDILSRSINVEDFSLIYAGAQKNLGPSGVTVVIIKKDLLEQCPNNIPTMLNYQTHAKNSSLYNTPPTFSIYMLSLVLEWVAEQGGVETMEKINQKKAELLYHTIDESEGFYIGHAEKGSRSLMNVTFNLSSDELTSVFLSQAKEEGFVGLGGHRMVGGCRASIYNAVPLESCEALALFMKSFQAKYR
ncbi:3-phosphoserine/phosphohydroxythreonine transaminase [Bacillus sp. CHD6a]|uniref:3-phosphoserine/phosphohydroxythreonine transaminase n=1 Tax=Bacillus sp. CHD6a TaxID=1643452 RepID=UPI0006CDB87A|nr:3-phosphoserine/phosphohydroxythreonine transaminase [Bacillus sp. CHD6a]KPB04917.1 MFS transporter [Bacillus sp. CHD6a]